MTDQNDKYKTKEKDSERRQIKGNNERALLQYEDDKALRNRQKKL